jgi:hypothetical protein
MKPFLGEEFHLDKNTAITMLGISLRFSSRMQPVYTNGINAEPPRQVDSLDGHIKIQQRSKGNEEVCRIFGSAPRRRSHLDVHDISIRELPWELQEKLVNTWAEVEKYLKDRTKKEED